MLQHGPVNDHARLLAARGGGGGEVKGGEPLIRHAVLEPVHPGVVSGGVVASGAVASGVVLVQYGWGGRQCSEHGRPTGHTRDGGLHTTPTTRVATTPLAAAPPLVV